LTNTLRGNNGANVNAMNVDLPAPFGPTTRSSRFTGAPRSHDSSVDVDHRGHAVGPVLDDLAVVVERHRRDAPR
jgi:hypothetical protein